MVSITVPFFLTAVAVSSLPVPKAGPAPADNLPKGWDMRFDKGTGRYFYVNHYTKTTSWEPPLAAIKTGWYLAVY